MQIYEVFSLVMKEKENFIKPKKEVITAELDGNQLQSLENLSSVMAEYGKLDN